MARDPGPERFLGWRQVRDLTGLSRTTAWRMRQAGDFPDPVPISPGRVAWRERDITRWNESRGLPHRTSGAAAGPNRPTPARPREDRVPAPPQTTTAPDGPPSRPGRKRGPNVAAGQLGFDF